MKDQDEFWGKWQKNQGKLRDLIKKWHCDFAPGLNPQPIPDNAIIVGPLLPLNPYGLQYGIQIKEAYYPRHQSGPGATVVGVVNEEGILVKEEFREETGKCIIKCAGGFAGNKQNVAKEIVEVFNKLPGEIKVTSDIWPNLVDFIKKLYIREYGIEIKQYPIFFGKPLGWPNIKICSIMGMVEIDLKNQGFSSGRIINFSKARDLYDKGKFGDVNTAEAVLEVIKRFK